MLVQAGFGFYAVLQRVSGIQIGFAAQLRFYIHHPAHIGASEQAGGGFVAHQYQSVLFFGFVFFNLVCAKLPFRLGVNACVAQFAPHLVELFGQLGEREGAFGRDFVYKIHHAGFNAGCPFAYDVV